MAIRSFFLRMIPFLALLTTPAFAQAPGGFLEKADSTAVRPRLTPSQIQSFLPARGPFLFPAPYNTRGIRLTNASAAGSLQARVLHFSETQSTPGPASPDGLKSRPPGTAAKRVPGAYRPGYG